MPAAHVYFTHQYFGCQVSAQSVVECPQQRRRRAHHGWIVVESNPSQVVNGERLLRREPDFTRDQGKLDDLKPRNALLQVAQSWLRFLLCGSSDDGDEREQTGKG